MFHKYKKQHCHFQSFSDWVTTKKQSKEKKKKLLAHCKLTWIKITYKVNLRAQQAIFTWAQLRKWGKGSRINWKHLWDKTHIKETHSPLLNSNVIDPKATQTWTQKTKNSSVFVHLAVTGDTPRSLACLPNAFPTNAGTTPVLSYPLGDGIQLKTWHKPVKNQMTHSFQNFIKIL